MIYELGERRVTVAAECFVAPSATLSGSVVLERDASVWFGATVRGDNDLVTIGEESNVQDNCVLHTDEGIQLRLGRGVTVGHQVVLHGCEVGDFSLIGIGSVILNRAKLGRYCIVGANALVTEGKEYPDRSLLLGSPARAVRQVTDDEVRALEESARHYVDNARRFLRELRPDARY